MITINKLHSLGMDRFRVRSFIDIILLSNRFTEQMPATTALHSKKKKKHAHGISF